MFHKAGDSVGSSTVYSYMPPGLGVCVAPHSVCVYSVCMLSLGHMGFLPQTAVTLIGVSESPVECDCAAWENFQVTLSRISCQKTDD